MMTNQKRRAPANPPLVTVGLTCFNAADTILRALESAQSQSWPNIEILVVDDCSSDESVARIQDLASRDDRIRLIRHRYNGGTAVARNTILHNASGEFIAFFDDDDVSDVNRILSQWWRIRDYEETHGTDKVFCYTNRSVIDEGGKTLHRVYPAIGRRETEPHGSVVADFLLWHYEDAATWWGHLGSCTLMFKRGLIGIVGDFDERFRRCAEWDLAIRFGFENGHFIGVDEPLVTQYVTATADKSGTVPLKHMLLLRRKYKSYLKKRHVYTAAIAIAHARFHYAKGHRWRSLFYLSLACLCSPTKVLLNEFSKRIRSRA
jgi:glycosyltransferase involved in cell wall biosynthesis